MSLAQPLAADTMAEVRAALTRLPGTADVRARVEIRTKNAHKVDEHAARQEQGTISVDVARLSGNLMITFPQGLMQRAAQEAQQRVQNAEASGPTRSSLGEVNAVSIAEALDHAPVLLRQLARAKFLGQRSGSFNGKPVRIASFAIQPNLPKAEKKYVKKIDVTLRLWLDADGTPLVAEETSAVKLGFLFLTFERKAIEKSTFVRRDDHLVTVRRDATSSGAGIGQSFNTSSQMTITLQ